MSFTVRFFVFLAVAAAASVGMWLIARSVAG